MYVAVVQPLENYVVTIPITSVMGYKYVAVFDGFVIFWPYSHILRSWATNIPPSSTVFGQET